MKAPLQRLLRILRWAGIAAGSLVVLLLVAWLILYATAPAGECLHGDCENGVGSMRYPSGNIYRGQFAAGKANGQGEFSSPAGDRYAGQWLDGEKHGYGVYSYPDASVYRGQFVRNKKEGRGEFVWPDGIRYTGNWRDNEPNGQGVVLYGEDLRLSGEYRNGRIYSGAGIYIYDDGSRYIGHWQDGKRHGPGLQLAEDGAVVGAGRWEADKLVQPREGGDPVQVVREAAGEAPATTLPGR